MSQSPNFIANGTINPSCFVIQDTSVNNAVDQATGTGTFIVGISQEWQKYAPIPGATTEAADPGDPIAVYGEAAQCLLQSSTAGWTTGDRLTSDASGHGVTASTTNYYGAIALETVTGSGLGRVQVLLGKNP